MKLIKSVSDRIRVIRLKREKRLFEKENRIILDEYEYFDMHHDDSTPPEAAMVVSGYSHDIRRVETEKLRRLAEKWGIELKNNWLQMVYSKKGEQLHLLSDEAVNILNDTIKKRRRENIEWWVTKVIVPVMGAITGLIGVLLAVYALSNKK